MGIIEASVIVILLIVIYLFIKKKRSTCSSKCAGKTTKPAQQTSEAPSSSSPSQNDAANAQAEPAQTTPMPAVSAVKTQAPAVSQAAKDTNSSVQQPVTKKTTPNPEQVKKVRDMVEFVSGSAPNDSILSRHHQAEIEARIDRCLNDAQQLAQLTHDFQNQQTVSASKPKAPEAKAVATVLDDKLVLLPQDSVLSRHYKNHIRSMIEQLVAPRPTDSILRRHYEALVDYKLAQCLNDKQAMNQLIAEYQQAH